MQSAKKRMYLLLVAFIGIAVTYTLIYKWAYGTFEGSETTYAAALQTVVEALTTAGFGGDAPWSSTFMNLFVALMNLTGVSLFFITIPLVVIPFLRTTLSAPPKSTNKEDHIVIASDSSKGDALITELDKTDKSYIFLEDNSEQASEFYRSGISVVNADPISKEGLEQANLEKADSIITDISDKENVSAIYLARQINSEAERISVVRDRQSEQYTRQAGADEVFNVAKETGSVIAEHSVRLFSEKFEDLVVGNSALGINKLVAYKNSPIVGLTIEEFSEEYLEHENIIGGWTNGEFMVSPTPEMEIEPNSVFFITGAPSEDIEATEVNEVSNPQGGKVLICGYGRIGREVEKRVDELGMDSVVLDKDEEKNPDIVADVSNTETFENMNLDEFKSVVLAVNDDVVSTYACTIIRSLDDKLRIVSRANNVDSVQNMYLAGADQVVSVPKIKGSYWASVLGRRDSRYNPHSESVIRKVHNDGVEGETLKELELSGDTGARAIAVKDDSGWKTEDLGDIELSEGFEILIIGTEDELEEAVEVFEDTEEEKSD